MSEHHLIFDCDGVLVNSEEIVQDIELELLAELGLHYDRRDFALRFLGVSNQHFQSELNADSQARLNRPLPETFFDVLHERARLGFLERLQAFPGIDAVVSEWPGHVAVASSSSISGLEFKLGHTALKPLFDPHIYSAEHVHAGKPDPAIYLHTASCLGVSPGSCIVVEDSVNGVLSAVAAGMRVVGFVAGAHCSPEQEQLLRRAGASLVVESMTDLSPALEDLCLGKISRA